MVSVKFNDQHIPDSPFKVHVAPSTGDVQKLRVENLQEQSLQVSLVENLMLIATCVMVICVRLQSFITFYWPSPHTFVIHFSCNSESSVKLSWAVLSEKFDTSAQAISTSFICVLMCMRVILWSLHPFPDLLWNSTFSYNIALLKILSLFSSLAQRLEIV